MWLKIISLKLFLILAFFVGTTFYETALGEEAVVSPNPPTPIYRATASYPQISAESFVVFDALTGEIITAVNGDEVRPIASITKLFSAAAALQSGLGDESVTIMTSDVAALGRAGRLSVGESYTAYELIFPLLLESSNDAAAALERSSANSLVTDTQSLISHLGGDKTQVVDASGLSPLNVSSAAELALLTSSLFKSYPHLFDITQLSRRVGEHVVWTNNSPVRDQSYRGGKHGYTEAANRTLVAVFLETLKSGHSKSIGYVLLGSDDLALDTEKLRHFVNTAVTFE